jgi:hypothetical protein
MWNIKCFVILVINGATGIVTKDYKIYGNNTRKAINWFYTKPSCMRDFPHNTESTTI